MYHSIIGSDATQQQTMINYGDGSAVGNKAAGSAAVNAVEAVGAKETTKHRKKVRTLVRFKT